MLKGGATNEPMPVLFQLNQMSLAWEANWSEPAGQCGGQLGGRKSQPCHGLTAVRTFRHNNAPWSPLSIYRSSCTAVKKNRPRKRVARHVSVGKKGGGANLLVGEPVAGSRPSAEVVQERRGVPPRAPAHEVGDPLRRAEQPQVGVGLQERLNTAGIVGVQASPKRHQPGTRGRRLQTQATQPMRKTTVVPSATAWPARNVGKRTRAHRGGIAVKTLQRVLLVDLREARTVLAAQSSLVLVLARVPRRDHLHRTIVSSQIVHLE